MWRWSRSIRCASRFCTIYRYRWANSLNDKTFSTGHISLDSISQTQYLFRHVRLAPRQKQEARRAKAKRTGRAADSANLYRIVDYLVQFK